MKQKTLALGASPVGQTIRTFTCHYCARAEGTFNEDCPEGWGKTRTGRLGCYMCFRAIHAYELEIMSLDVAGSR